MNIKQTKNNMNIQQIKNNINNKINEINKE